MTDTPKAFHLSPEIHVYLVAHARRPTRSSARVIEETEALGVISLIMQIAPEQGAFMTLLARIGARAGHRGRHVHRLLGALHRPRASRPAASCCAAT